MTRGIRQMNLASMDDADLAALREGVASALQGDARDFDHLLEDIDAEIDLRRREP